MEIAITNTTKEFRTNEANATKAENQPPIRDYMHRAPKRGGSAEAQFSAAYSVNRSSCVFTTQSSRFWDSSSQRAIS